MCPQRRLCLLALFGAALAAAGLACGKKDPSRSGVDRDKKLVDLDAGERSTLCAWVIDELEDTDTGRTTDCLGHPCGDAGATCDDFRRVDVCVSAFASVKPTCTVASVENCVPAMKAADDVCVVFSAKTCTELLDCYL